jgi:hypothetical protein
MRKISITSMIFVIGFSFLNLSCVHFGNGNIVSSEITLNQFEKLNIHGSTKVRFHQSQDYRAVLTVDSNLVEFVEFLIRNNTLYIETKTGHSYSFNTLLVDIYCPGLTAVSVSGSGNFLATDTMIAESFELNVSGSGRTNISIICDNFLADISGSGDIIITGTGNDSNIRISGSGDFNGIDYKTNNVTARISGSGSMNIWVLEYLQANVSGSGSIKYRGNPIIDFSGSGSGRISAE